MQQCLDSLDSVKGNETNNRVEIPIQVQFYVDEKNASKFAS